MEIQENISVIWNNLQNHLRTASKEAKRKKERKKKKLDHKKSTSIARKCKTHSGIGSCPLYSTSTKAENKQRSLQIIHIQNIGKKNCKNSRNFKISKQRRVTKRKKLWQRTPNSTYKVGNTLINSTNTF